MYKFKLKSGGHVELPGGTVNPFKQTPKGPRVTPSQFQTWQITDVDFDRKLIELRLQSTDHRIEDPIKVEAVGPDQDGFYNFKEPRLGALVFGRHVRLVTITNAPTSGRIPGAILFAEPYGESWRRLSFPDHATPDDRNAMIGLYQRAAEKFGKPAYGAAPGGFIDLADATHDYSTLWSRKGKPFDALELDGLTLQ